MNQPLLLHVVERLESFLGKLPATIQKPILSELTPLKELFLQQRQPRFLFTGSHKTSLQEIMGALFASAESAQMRDALIALYRWQDVNLAEKGVISILDARGADESAAARVQEELKRRGADIIFFVDDGEDARGPRKRDLDDLVACLDWNEAGPAKTKIIGLGVGLESRKVRLEEALSEKPAIRDRLLQVIDFSTASDSSAKQSSGAQQLMSILARELPNQARIEMIRISRDREAQHEVAHVLVKSTTAICAAIGAQPIPLADLPILTTLQLVMVSGIMYVSGRERSLRAATEFIGALGANVGAGMLLREGTRAVLKFFPGWGNVVCGMVAGAGTYAIGRAATVFFLEGVSLKDARRTYLASRKKPRLLTAQESEKPAKPKKLLAGQSKLRRSGDR
ncbi:MAG: hypothetical protein DMF47_05565 [Verrucomicrobia bacterium]|nr:MAG: hypothetical protein DMF47_05565 [Verrucomicrobiota bacterium]